MSQQVLRYSRPNAELRGMVSRLLSPAQIRALAAAPDLEGALRMLMDTPYQPRLSTLPEGVAAVAAAERVLLESLVESYQRVALLLRGRAAALVIEMSRRWDLDNLKAILRAKVRGEPAEVVRSLLVPLGRLSQLPLEDLLRAEDVEAIARALEGTEFEQPLRHSLPRYAAEGSLFPVETALDLHYYRRLWATVVDLPPSDRQKAEPMMGTRYDLLNVEWIVRYRLLYGLSPEETFNYTLPHGRHIDDAVVRHAAAADGMEGIAAALPEPYRSLLAGLGTAPDPIERLGVLTQRYLVGVARAALAGYPFHVGVAIAFLWLKEAEAHDIRAALEAKRYDRPPEAILEQMWGIA